MRRSSRVALLNSILCAAFLFFSAATSSREIPPFGVLTRLNEGVPIMKPQGSGFEENGVFNPAVVKEDGRFIMIYRAQDRDGTSRLGYATSKDGVHFTRRDAPVLSPETDYERGGGVEDPRLVRLGKTYYLTYTAYNKKDAQLCLATSRDLIGWRRLGVIMPAYKGRWNVGWTKSGAIVPQKINGRYWMYFMADAAGRPNQMGVAYSTDLVHWTEPLDHPVLELRPGYFDSYVVEPGPTPIITEEGILLVYNGADDDKAYATGWALFDKRDPTRVIARSAQPIFKAERDWERVGQVPNVVFVEAMVRDRDRWLFYYGGADKYVGVAAALRVDLALLSAHEPVEQLVDVAMRHGDG